MLICAFDCALFVWVLTEQAVLLRLYLKGGLKESPGVQGGGISHCHR